MQPKPVSSNPLDLLGSRQVFIGSHPLEPTVLHTQGFSRTRQRAGPGVCTVITSVPPQIYIHLDPQNGPFFGTRVLAGVIS